jgi:CRP/FNR family cyclic AMP-dependent transcriptional regulator
VIKTIENLVAEHPMFRELDAAHRTLIAGCGRNRSFADGELLMREGDPADEFFAIRHGTVTLYLQDAQRGEIAIQSLGPGQIVGLSWLFPPYRVQFDARAIGPVNTISFDGACLRGKCDADPEFGYALMKRLAATMTHRLQATRLQLLDVYGSQT